MRKFINFVKKPLLFISTGVFALALVLLLIVSCVPMGKTYISSRYQSGREVVTILSFKGSEMTRVINNGDYQTIERDEYKIEDGELFTKNGNDWTKEGKVTKDKIIFISKFGSTETRETFNRKSNPALKNVVEFFAIVSGLVLIASVAVRVADKKGLIKTAEVVETTATVSGTNEVIEISAEVKDSTEKTSEESKEEKKKK